MLNIYKKLFELVHEQDLKYCHFKSNDHLDAGLDGETDLDIVILTKDATDFIRLLHACDFKRTEAGFGVKNQSREGYLGYDRDTGKLVYIDLHFSIIIGKNRIREYALNDLSNDLIKHRVLDSKSGVYIASPVYEFFLLVVRASIKVRFRDSIKNIFGVVFYDQSWVCQHDWLKERYHPNELKVLLQKYLVNCDLDRVSEYFAGYPSLQDLFYLKKIAKKSLYSSLKYGAVTTFSGMLLKEANGALCYVNRRLLSNRLPLNRRYLSSGGRFIALIGVDGAGKSTQIKHLTKYLSWKLDVSNVYLGAGDGSASWHRTLLIKARKLLSSREGSYNDTSYEGKKNSMGYIRKFARNVWAISLLIEKNAKLKVHHRLAKRSTIVVCDRYPQNNVKNFNDGPMLSEYRQNTKWSFLSKLADLEEHIYSGKKYGSPDLVVKLIIKPAVSVERGQSTSIEYLERRIDAVNAMTFGDACVVVEIDASQSLVEVSKDITLAIWRIL